MLISRGEIEKLEKLLTPLAGASGLEIVDIEATGSGPVLRIYIDGEGGVTVDDCAAFSRVVSDLIDVEFSGWDTSYRLEVSSPGIERVIKKERDFLRFRGKRIKLKTFVPLDGQRNFTGVIYDFHEGALLLKHDSEIIRVEKINIARANLVYEGDDVNAMGSK